MGKPDQITFDKTKFKIYSWKNWMYLHWLINPGLAFNELLLGQRIPEITLEDITADKPLSERIFVPCPHCGKLHDAKMWSAQNGTAFKNWFGLYCPECGNVIPCMRNLTAGLILILTAPLWIWFRDTSKEKWLSVQPSRYQSSNERISGHNDNIHWVRMGLRWGAIMFITMTFIFPFLIGYHITGESVLSGLLIWSLTGLGFGYAMKVIINKKVKKTFVESS